MPLSLQLALLSCSGTGFSGEGLPLDSQCIGGENICRAKGDGNDFRQEYVILISNNIYAFIMERNTKTLNGDCTSSKLALEL